MNKTQKLKRKHKRVRGKIRSDSARPRLSVFRSNKHIYAQIIDDENGKTLIGISDTLLKAGKTTKTDRARLLGKTLAEKAKEAKIQKVVYDRGGRRYHGRVRALAEGAREGGLEF